MTGQVGTHNTEQDAAPSGFAARACGFSLLELLIVVAIILIIATIAIPALLESRKVASESQAIAALRLINTAQTTYSGSNGGNFAATLTGLGSDGLLDDRFSGDPAAVGWYRFTMTQPGGRTTYRIDADPGSSTSGRFNYYSLPDGVIRYDDDADNPFPQGTPVK